MSDYTLLVGDALQQLRTLPADSVHCVVTSPPYFGLRDYQTATWEGGDADCDHSRPAIPHTGLAAAAERADGRHRDESGTRAAKALQPYRSVCGKCGARRVDQQIGLEAEPSEFIDKLVAVFAEVRRVLHPTGQLFVNISDTRSDSREWLGIPHRLVFALQQDGWRWEDEVIWAKKAPMPGSQTNRFTRSHEYVFMLNKSRDAFFDGEAVKEPQHGDGRKRGAYVNGPRVGQPVEQFKDNGTRTRRSVWLLGPESFDGAHYATFPTKLVEPCVLSGSSAHGVCSRCLAPWQRLVERETTPHMDGKSSRVPGDKRPLRGSLPAHLRTDPGRSGFGTPTSVTLGWTATCQCQAGVVPAVVLDPFFGSGTVAKVALTHGRHFIGIDLDPRNLDLATQRIEQTQPLLLSL